MQDSIQYTMRKTNPNLHGTSEEFSYSEESMPIFEPKKKKKNLLQNSHILKKKNEKKKKCNFIY